MTSDIPLAVDLGEMKLFTGSAGACADEATYSEPLSLPKIAARNN